MFKKNKIQSKKYLLISVTFICSLLLLFSGKAVLGDQKNEVSAWSREHDPVIL